MAYDVPASSDLKARYPAFAKVDDDIVTYWITDAQRFVDTSWSEGDYPVGLLALAAHNMALSGLGTDENTLGDLPAGVTSFKMGPMSVTLTPEAANAAGDFASTRYGKEYLRLASANRGGAVIVPSGVMPCVGPYLPFGWW